MTSHHLSSDPPQRRRLAVVVNPTKLDDLDAARALIARACREHGWDEPSWAVTTEIDTGARQAHDAVHAGADVVASLGGDGTVRAVATALVGTDVALGLLPGGTGNLLARNLGVPVESLQQAVEAMLTGSDRSIDVGLVGPGGRLSAVEIGAETAPSSTDTTGTSSRPRDDEEVFLVMTGLGLDGEVMANTNERVKGVLGWPAYVLAAGHRLTGRGFTAHAQVADSSGSVRQHARTVVIGNCGTLQGGLELMPDARVDDGILDLVVVAPHGIFGWISIVAALLTRNRSGHRRLDRLTGTGFTIEAERPVEAEIDGDPIGPRTTLEVRVLPGSLVVRVG